MFTLSLTRMLAACVTIALLAASGGMLAATADAYTPVHTHASYGDDSSSGFEVETEHGATFTAPHRSHSRSRTHRRTHHRIGRIHRHASSSAHAASYRPPTGQPRLDATPYPPSFSRRVSGRTALVHVPYARRHGHSACGLSDVAVYNVHGRPFAQRRDRTNGEWYWVTADGRAVAGFDSVNCDFVVWTSGVVRVAAWRG